MGIKHDEFDVVGPFAYLTPEQESAVDKESPVEIETFDLFGIAINLRAQLNLAANEEEKEALKRKLQIVQHVGELLAPYINDRTEIEADKELGLGLDQE